MVLVAAVTCINVLAWSSRLVTWVSWTVDPYWILQQVASITTHPPAMLNAQALAPKPTAAATKAPKEVRKM